MAPNPLTLEEAAERLELTVEEFKRRLKTDPLFKDLDRGKIRDGTSFRFKVAAIEELARELGAGSNPENPIPGSDDESGHDSDDFKVTPSAPAKKAAEEPLLFGDDDDVFSLTADEPAAPAPKPSKGGSGSDSDVRLDGGKAKKGKGGDSVPTEEISVDFGGPGSAVIKGGSSAKLSAPKSSSKLTSDSGKNLAKPGTGDSSEFELSLDADSDDFELKLNTDTSDEVSLGDLPKDAPGGSGSGRRGGESGILSRKPNDSGPSLEKGKGKASATPPPAKDDSDSDSDVDFELTLDSSAAVSGTKLGGGLSSKKVTADSDSEFELTLDDSGESELESAVLGEDEGSKGDIFETDFEIPPMEESGSEAVALDSDTDLGISDPDLAVDETDPGAEGSGSEVVLLEDDEEAPAAKGKPKPKPGKKVVVEEDEDEGDVDLADVEAADDDDESAAGALKGVKGKRRDEDDDDDEEALAGAGAGVYRPVPWGIVPLIFLVPAFVLTLVGGLLGYELLQTMLGYQQPQKPGAPLVRSIAKSLDMPLNDQ